MAEPTSLQNRLRTERIARKLTQEALAAEVGISRSHVAMIETGGDLPGRDTLVALLTFLGLPLDLMAAGPGVSTEASAQAVTEEEALWLHAIRAIPANERGPLLNYVLSRAKPAGS